MGSKCKEVSGGLQTFISRWMDGKKAVMASSTSLSKKDVISLQEHEKEWSVIMEGVGGAVDASAIQDGHLDYDELKDFLILNKQMAEKHSLKALTNLESFDRDMPIKFPPIKFEKPRLKMEAAREAVYDKANTYKFSNFMSPQSSFESAGHLFNRYKEYLHSKKL